MSTQPYVLPGHSVLPEPEMLFHPDREGDRHEHPLKGLCQFGPFSRSLVNHVLDPIRLAIIAPTGGRQQIAHLVRELELHHYPKERAQYLIEFPGFSRIFGLRAVLGSPEVQLELPPQLDVEIQKSGRPHHVLAEALTKALSILESRRTEFDVVLIYLPDKWTPCFTGAPDEDFDLHDYLKGVAATRRIPTQIIREASAIKYHCRASVSWRLGIALYTKAGGIPWTMADADPDTAFVGLSYSVRPTSLGDPAFVTCCSQVFDSDGAGLEFIAYETGEAQIIRDNPFLSRAEMRRVMARSLSLYQRRHAGRAPKRIVIHKSTEFKSDEVAGCFDAWGTAAEISLIQIKQDVAWHGINVEAPREGTKGLPGAYPCTRGTFVQMGGREVLLWTQGNAPSIAGGRNYYKEGKGIPSPLLLVRHAGHGGWDESCRSVLGLTKMNWNNDSLYDRLPVTLGYAHVLARTVKRMPHVAGGLYQFRFFM